MLNHNGDRSLWPLAITHPGPTATPGSMATPGDNPIGPGPGDPAPVERVRLEGIWHRYGAAAADPWTLRGVDLCLAPGELLGLPDAPSLPREEGADLACECSMAGGLIDFERQLRCSRDLKDCQ
jgi:hypothetical protein